MGGTAMSVKKRILISPEIREMLKVRRFMVVEGYELTMDKDDKIKIKKGKTKYGTHSEEGRHSW